MTPFNFLDLPEYTNKPRDTGITSLIDKGLDLIATQQLIAMSGDFIDLVKLGFGTSVLYQEKILSEKIQLLRSANIKVCAGGTLFELTFLQNKFKEYLKQCKALGFDCIEISNGEVAMTETEKTDCIKRASDAGFTVISEVGRKDAVKDNSLTIEQRVFEIEQELKAGAWKVILEARESGSVGIFSNDNSVKEDDVQTLTNKIDAKHLIFEAPQSSQQAWLIKKLGNGVNLGNIQTSDVIALTCLRLGLRADTLTYFHGDHYAG